MSIERTNGAWRVRWREAGRNRSKVLGRKADAVAFDAEVRRRRRTGELAGLDAGKQTLAEFAEEWWTLHAVPNLSIKTRRTYASCFDAHVLPRIGGFPLRELSPEVAQRFAADLEAAGIGPAARRKTLALVGSIVQRAAEWGRVGSNPFSLVRKPPARRERAVHPLPPAIVETMRAAVGHRDAVLLSVLAYGGLRPQEALALRWGDVGERTILVERAVADGVVKATKTGQRRSVRLLAPLRADLAEWRLASGRPGEEALVFPARAGSAWREHDWRNWRRRVFSPVAAECGLERARPYDMRHSFVSLLIHEGRNVVEVARQAGHSPTMALDTYAHVFDESEDGEKVPAEVQIRLAREKAVPFSYLEAGGEGGH